MGGPTLLETNEVTIIDINKIDNATENATIPLEECKEVLKIADEIKEAFSHRRVVYLINHDISEEEMKNVFTILQKFLALPDEVKEKYKSHQRKNLHGYVPRNSEQFYGKDKFEIRESFNIIGEGRDFPIEEIPEYTKCIKTLSEKLLRLSKLLLELFAIGLDDNKGILVNSHKDLWNHLNNYTDLKVMYYPPVEEETHPGIIRCGEHRDYGTFTLQMQDSDGGLEVCGENREWRSVGYIPGAIFLNTADLLEVWSSGEYPATLHRVVVPEEDHIRNHSLYSMGFFVVPDNPTVVKPIHPLPGYEVNEIIAGEYIGNRLDSIDVQVSL